jgi:endogenous inhibitor of DNA gyrase (YacG/DUF329 family)
MSDGDITQERLCPVCGKAAQFEHRPFCSARCRLIDLGRWLGGEYRIETQETPEEGAPEEGEK